MRAPKFSRSGCRDGHRYGRVYDRQEGQEGEDWTRLVVGADGDHVGLLIRLAEAWSSPDFGIEYLSHQSLGDQVSGHYLSPLVDEANMNAFLIEHREFLEGYGGHDLWLGHPETGELLVYDRNNVIFAYGPAADFAEILEERGFREGAVDLPDEHVHGLDSSFASHEAALLSHFEWEWSDLDEDDDH
jgi:hypothetical protein